MEQVQRISAGILLLHQLDEFANGKAQTRNRERRYWEHPANGASGMDHKDISGSTVA